MTVFLTLLLAVGAVEVSPVAKVITLLDELKGKVAGDLAAEELMMEEYTKFCDAESNKKEDAIKSNTRTVGDLEATITDAAARIGELGTEVEELAGKISEAESELKNAAEVREGEHKAFADAESELVETVDSLERAVVVISRGQTSFLQNHGEDFKKLTAGLSKIVEASWVNAKDKAVVQSLLQSTSGESEDDEDLSLAPQASAAAFSSSSGGILDTVKDMKSKAESTLSDARTEEMKASHAFEMVKNSLDMELSTMQKRMGQATSEKSGLEADKATAEEELAVTKKTVAADEKYLEELKQSCSMKATQWEQRQKDAAGEMAAIAKAKEVLESGVKVFLQVSTKAKATAMAKDDDRRDRVLSLLSTIRQKDGSYMLAQIASEAREGPFEKVKGLIDSMIARLEQEAAEEADAKAFCDSETSKSKAKQADFTARSDKYAVRIEKATASMESLKEQIKSLQAQMAEMDAAHSEATSIRTKEHEEYLKATADYKASADAVANAVGVLQAYYSQGSFVQQAPEFGSAKGDIAETIMGMLEVAESDFTTLLAEAEADEKTAQTAYDKLTEQNTITKAANTEEVKGKEAEVKSTETALLNYKEDYASTGKELDAVLAYLDKLKPQCETKVMTYAERVAKREAEIAGLKEALEILS
jgi:chromosome segregation ATPase